MTHTSSNSTGVPKGSCPGMHFWLHGDTDTDGLCFSQDIAHYHTHTHTLSHHNTVRLAPTLIVLSVGGIICELAVLALQENLLRGVGLTMRV